MSFILSLDNVTIGFDKSSYSVLEDGRIIAVYITVVEDIASPVSVDLQTHSNSAKEGQGI